MISTREDWKEADGATFVYNPNLITPMGWGIAAFASESDAQTYHDEHDNAGFELYSVAGTGLAWRNHAARYGLDSMVMVVTSKPVCAGSRPGPGRAMEAAN
jgi:hypothetical protein